METKSTHKAEVVPVVLEEHPNADSLSIVKIYGYTAVVRTTDWKDKSKGVYIPPDSLCPNSEQFSFLFDSSSSKRYDINEIGESIRNKEEGQYVRITAMRLRGVQSYGLLIPAEDWMQIDTDMADHYGIKHYEPSIAVGSTYSEATAAPPGMPIPKYDVDSLFRYPDIFSEGEKVHVTEKIHGANGRWTYREGEMHCGSHKEWKIKRDDVIWWKVLETNPEIEEFCKANPNIVVFGEVCGAVQKGFNYGIPSGKITVLVFDLFKDGEWLSIEQSKAIGSNLQWVPIVVTDFPYNFDKIKQLAEGDSLVSNSKHIREGIVVKPMQERFDLEIGRVQLKVVSDKYYASK